MFVCSEKRYETFRGNACECTWKYSDWYKYAPQKHPKNQARSFIGNLFEA